MKLLILTVSAIAVLQADSRGFAGGHKERNSVRGGPVPVSPNLHKNLKKLLNDEPQADDLEETPMFIPHGPQDRDLHEAAQQMEMEHLKMTKTYEPNLVESKGQHKSTTRIQSCPSGSDLVGGQCLEFRQQKKLSWNDAKAACADDGHSLASLDDPQAVLAHVMEKYDPAFFWAGGSDSEQEGTWTWLDGTPIDSNQFPWAINQPNNGGNGEDCLRVPFNNGYNDAPCFKKMYYICEIGEIVDQPCPDGSVYVGGQCLEFNTEKLTWNDAKDACAADNKILASLDNPEAVLGYVLRKYGNTVSAWFWAGGSDITEEGTFTWLNGTPISSDPSQFPWGRGQPNNNHGREDCLHLPYRGGYNNADCSRKMNYICEDPIVDTCVCGTVNRVQLIVGGITTEENEYPWQVALVAQGSTRVGCGGSLINDRWVLTAAHCTGGSLNQVILGNHYVNQTDSFEMRVNIKEVFNHPNYTGRVIEGNDFALVELATPLDLEAVAPHIRPVCLPSASNPSQYDDVNAVVTGWGRLSTNGPVPNSLQEVTLKTMTNSECQETLMETDYEIYSSMICATNPGHGGCHGDSGGPMVTDVGSYFKLIGVVSWGAYGICGSPDYPTVFGRVTDAIDWISSTSSSGNTCPHPN